MQQFHCAGYDHDNIADQHPDRLFGRRVFVVSPRPGVIAQGSRDGAQEKKNLKKK